MRHPLHHSFRIPATFAALAEFLMDGLDPGDPNVWRYASWLDRGGDLFCGDIDSGLLGEPVPGDDPAALCRELGYSSPPLEILPFCWNGGDGLHYGWAVLAPELDAADHPCVSYAPGEDSARWLGDSTKEALENLLVGAIANWAERGPGQGLPSPAEDERWAAVCGALDLRPDVGSPAIGPGARSRLRIRPEVPAGWRYEPTGDGIGVLAEAAAFAPETVQVDDSGDDEEYLPVARRYLARGFPASALCVLKSLSGHGHEVVELMCEAYQQLGRGLLVERAELWLRLNPSDR
ncbi:hypothetical protein ACFT2C_18750 [Promicromonospora sp. NPDC057138]|uniref:hypothetical protein n=1 Tax=Promicromonospora sp. NPDC057138 TaxID=3346031 RepID=UPI00363E59BE